MGTLGPGGEVGGGVAVAVDDQAAAGTAKDPLGQPHLSSDIAAHRANLGGCKPAVADDQLGAEPRCLVGELAGELGPGDITDGTGQTPVGDEVGNGEVFQTEPVVGLDELAGDLVEKVSTDVGDVGVLPGQAPDRLGPVARAGPGRRDVMRQPAEAHHAAMQRHGCSEAADLGPVRSRCHSERDEASVQPNKPVIAGRSGQVATVGVQVGGLHVEADIPAGPVPTDGREQDLGARCHLGLPGASVELGDRTQQSPQPAGVIVDSDHADSRQGHRAGTALTDADRAAAAVAVLVAKPEAVPTTPFAFPPWEANPNPLRLGVIVAVGGERPTKINRSLLEHLGRDHLAPPKAGHMPGDGAIWSGDEDTSSGLTPLPCIERIDQVEARPWDLDLRFCPLGGKGIVDQPKTLVVGESGRSGVPVKHHHLRWGWSEREPEGGMPHGRILGGGCDIWGTSVRV